MRGKINYILFFLVCLFMVACKNTTSIEVAGQPIEFSWHIIVAILAGIYEVIARIIPTIKNYSFIAKIIEILVWISDFLNRKKK